ncbi:MAG: mechanosensitive ion channel family protein [Candidatus Lokiarchaeota archaeon]|nr:mechanosensitive ion channel family protein [Candidatus Lokiarchaeota archaeon]
MLFQFEIVAFLINAVIGVGIILIIWLVQSILGRIVKRKLGKRKNAPKDAINGIMYTIRIISAFIILFVFLNYFGLINPSTSLNFITIFSTTIGFSSAIAIGNFVAGMYLIASRPYQVGDYIQMGSLEGFVIEIGLNYSKIRDATTGVTTMIPNKVAMNENMQVYKVPREYKAGGKPRNMNILQEDNVVRYRFFIEEELSIPAAKMEGLLESVGKKWTAIFGYVPRFFVAAIGWRVRVRVIVTADTMKAIQENMDKFLDDIWLAINKPGGGSA